MPNLEKFGCSYSMVGEECGEKVQLHFFGKLQNDVALCVALLESLLNEPDKIW